MISLIVAWLLSGRLVGVFQKLLISWFFFHTQQSLVLKQNCEENQNQFYLHKHFVNKRSLRKMAKLEEHSCQLEPLLDHLISMSLFSPEFLTGVESDMVFCFC